MVSKNNLKWKQQRDAERVPHYGLRKLSVGVASVLLSTTLYMGATASADTVSEPSGEPAVTQPTSATTGSSTGSATANAQPKSTTDQPANVVTGVSTDNTTADTKPAQTANAVTPQPTADQPAGSVTSGVQPAANSVAPKNDVSAQSAPASASAALPKQPANVADSTQPFMNLAVTSDNNDVAKPTRETVGSQWRIHYIDSTNREHELKDPTVINMQYVRTNTPQSDGMIQHGDWSYVPGSFKLTGTPITVNDSDNPVKEDNVTNNGKNEDVFTITVWHPAITGYTMHDNVTHTRLQDHLLNYAASGEFQAPTMGQDFDVEYDPIDKRSVAVKFIDDQHVGQQVGQAITLTGHDGDTVNLKLTVPDKYELADGQQLPTSYTFAKGSGDLKIHLVHKVVQREATINVQLLLTTAVHRRDNDYAAGTVTQARWKQLEEQFGDEIKYAPGGPDGVFEALPSVKAGTLTGHVDYDLVDERVTSLGDDWTTLNLGGKTYQLPNGDDVVNGIMIDGDTTWGKSFKEDNLKSAQIVHVDVDPDYATRAWHGYLSVNATNNDNDGLIDEVHSLGLQAGLVGDEPNALAKTIGDRAATAVEMSNKPIDLNLLRSYDFDFSEQNGQLRAKVGLPLAGVYVPYVEKTATRTINVTTPDGETKTVKQTATLAKQVDFGKHAHPDWTTGEWASYDVPTIPGYTASQTSVAKETVTGETKDQTVNITYTANDQLTYVNYMDAQGKTIHTTTVNGKTGQTVKVSNEVPAGWMITKGEVPSEITFGPDGHADTSVKIEHRHVTVTPDAPKTTADHLPDNPGKTYPAGVGHNDLNKTVTGTINVTMPDGQVKTVVKTAKLTRTADVDEVTGDVKYSDWTTGYWSDYTAPVVPGYTANYPYIAGQSVTGSMEDQTLEITYTANDQATHVNYVDAQGKTIHATAVNGKTGQTVKVSSEIPDGWKLVDGQSVPSEITFGPDGHTDVSVKIEHRQVTVTPDHPQTNGTKLPDNPAKTFNGVEANDLNKTITRTIKVTQPDGTVTNKVQTVKLTRTATVDEVTGEVTYGKWTTGAWDAYTIPSVKGYTASQASVAATPVDENTKDQTVEVSYTANKQSTTIKYADDKGQVVHTTTVNGVTGQTVKVPSEVPTGWMITKGQVPNEIAFGADGHEPIEVTVAHRHVTVDPDHPQINGTKLPDNPAQSFHGVEASDLNKTATRTIKVTTPDGKTTTTKQTVKLTRTATVDEVTGDVSYGKWTTGQWAKYDVPTVSGYTATQTEVAAVSVNEHTTDQTVNITYTANPQTTTVKYVDDKGEVIHTTTVDGVTNQTVTVPSAVPVGWTITKGQVPRDYIWR